MTPFKPLYSYTFRFLPLKAERYMFLIIMILVFVKPPIRHASETEWYWENNYVVNVELEYNPCAEIEDSQGEMQINQTRLRSLFPVIMKENFFFGLGAVYEGYLLNYRDTPSFYNDSAGKFVYQEDLPNDLHIIDVVIGTNYTFNEQWGIYGEIIPGIHSDFEDIDNSDMLVNGFFFLRYHAESGTEYRFGGGVTPSFGEPQVFPLFGMLCPVSEKYAFDLLLPSHAMFRFKCSEKTEMGLKAKMSIREFRLQDGGSWHDDILRYRQVTAGPYAEFILYKTMILRVESGYMLGRKFEFLNKGYDEQLWVDRLNNKFFLILSLRWAI